MKMAHSWVNIIVDTVVDTVSLLEKVSLLPCIDFFLRLACSALILTHGSQKTE